MVMSDYAASMEPPRRAARSRLRLLRAMRRCRKGDAIVPQAVPAKAPTPAAAPPAMPVAIAGAWKKKIVPRNKYAANRTAPNAVYKTHTDAAVADAPRLVRSEEHTSALETLMRIPYAVSGMKTQEYRTHLQEITTQHEQHPQ